MSKKRQIILKTYTLPHTNLQTTLQILTVNARVILWLMKSYYSGIKLFTMIFEV